MQSCSFLKQILGEFIMMKRYTLFSVLVLLIPAHHLLAPLGNDYEAGGPSQPPASPSIRSFTTDDFSSGDESSQWERLDQGDAQSLASASTGRTNRASTGRRSRALVLANRNRVDSALITARAAELLRAIKRRNAGRGTSLATRHQGEKPEQRIARLKREVKKEFSEYQILINSLTNTINMLRTIIDDAQQSFAKLQQEIEDVSGGIANHDAEATDKFGKVVDSYHNATQEQAKFAKQEESLFNKIAELQATLNKMTKALESDDFKDLEEELEVSAEDGLSLAATERAKAFIFAQDVDVKLRTAQLRWTQALRWIKDTLTNIKIGKVQQEAARDRHARLEAERRGNERAAEIERRGNERATEESQARERVERNAASTIRTLSQMQQDAERREAANRAREAAREAAENRAAWVRLGVGLVGGVALGKLAAGFDSEYFKGAAEATKFAEEAKKWGGVAKWLNLEKYGPSVVKSMATATTVGVSDIGAKIDKKFFQPSSSSSSSSSAHSSGSSSSSNNGSSTS